MREERVPSALEQYPISDFVEWHRQKTLVLNPHFQRRPIWSPAARSYLIDSILRQMPVPKIYIRSHIDPKTKKTIREVVDGQQRLRAIIDFAEGKLTLGKRAGEFNKKNFAQLTEEQQVAFLSYPMAVAQLINAKDPEVLEIFGRLNSYNLVLRPPERRHAEYQTEFKWSVYESAREWTRLWDDFKLLGVRERLRMADDSMMAEMYGILLDGLGEGDERSIDKIYKAHKGLKGEFPEEDETKARLKATLERLMTGLGGAIEGPMASRPHFMLLFAAVAHCAVGIPAGLIEQMPVRGAGCLDDAEAAIGNLQLLAELIEQEEPPESEEARAFWAASRAAPVRAASRRVRFPVYWRALLPQPLAFG